MATSKNTSNQNNIYIKEKPLKNKISNTIIMEIKSKPILMNLINVDNITPFTKRKIRKEIGITRESKLIELAEDSGVDLGKRQATRIKRTYIYFAELVNERILEERQEKKKSKPKPTQKTKTKEIKLGRNVPSMYSKIKQITDTAKIIIRGKKIYYSTTLDKKNKKTLSSQFYDFIMFDSEKSMLDILPDDKTAEVFMILGKKAKGKKTKQSFKEGSYNCLLLPIKNFIQEKIETAKAKKTQQNYKSRLNKLNALNEKYFNSGVDEDKIHEVANELQVDINISLPFQNNYIMGQSQKKPLRKFNFLNTRLNHVDYDILSHGDNVVEYTNEQLDDLFFKLTEEKTYFTYKRNLLNTTEIRTIDTIYRKPNPYREVVNKFEIENNLLECKLCDIKNKDVSLFIRQGAHLNQAIDGEGYSTELVYGKDFLHIDQSKAYSRYKMSKYYKGFPAVITDFRKCNKIVEVGYYRITNINFDNNLKLKAYNDWLKIYNNDNVYPSCELEFLTDNKVSFDIIEGCWGSVIDFDFNEDLMNGKTEEGIRFYCKYVGSMMCGDLTNSLYIRGEGDFVDNLVSEIDADKIVRYEDEVRVMYDKPSNYHLSHIAGFITAYMRLNMMEQLEEFEPDDIYRIACDGIYYRPKEIELKNCFRVEEKEPTYNQAGDSYISNNEDYSYLNGERLEVGEWRENNRVELHIGEGGAGKTHLNLIDKGFISPCFYAPSYKLSRRKALDYNCKSSVTAKLTTEDPVMRGLQSRFNNVLIIDEVSMMSNDEKDKIIKYYPNCKIIFCGDIGYQLPPIEGEEFKPIYNGKKIPIIQHTENHRVECDKLYKVLTNCRKMMKEDDEIKDYVFNNFPMIKKEDMDYNYNEDMILSATHTGKDYFTEKYKEQPKYYITKSDRIYGRGEITLTLPNTKDYEIRHAYTTHSIQGETAKGKLFIDTYKLYENKMIYTAISRAKKLDQIIFVE